MRGARSVAAAVIPLVALVAGCGRREPATVGARPSPSSRPSHARVLTAADVRAFVAVRSRAMQQLEDSLAEVDSHGGDVLGKVQEVNVAEREAARALGVDWRRFTWVHDEIGRLLTRQRQHDDQRVLGEELARSKEDLEAQLQAARDPATRQFLEAQLRVLAAQLKTLARDRALSPAEAEELRVLDSARAEIAILQGREDDIRQRLQALLQHGAPAGAATPAPRAK